MRLTPESRRLADALAASEARYRHLVENAPDIIYRTDTDGNFTFVNPIAEVIIGRRQEDLLGRSYLDLIHPDDREAMRRHYGRQWLRGTPTTYAEFRVNTRDRGDVWIGQNVQLILENGERAGFQAIARDITDRKLAEQALGRLQQQTESILNSAAEGIISVDNEGRVSMINHTAAQLLGSTVRDMLAQSAHDLLHGAIKCTTSECRVYAAFASGGSFAHQLDVFWRDDGTSFPVEFTSVPVTEAGLVRGAVLTFHDVSERLAIERMKDEFIAVVSHELRTPLTGIRASLGLLGAGLFDLNSEKGRRMIDLAINNADRLIELINNIVDLQRLASGDITMQFAPTQVEDIVERSVENVRGQAERAQVHVVAEYDRGEMLADGDRLVQALTNLLDNAIKFSPRDGTVTLGARLDARDVIFSVQDTGRGIPSEKIEAIFNRFEQVDASNARDEHGTGLGLAICRSIAELHGGRIWVESRVGEGSTFLLAVAADRA